MKPTCHECIEVKEIVKKKCMVQAALVLLLVLCFSCAAAQEAKDLTNACIISSPDKTTDKVHDGAYTSFWQSRTNEKPHLEFQTPEGESAQYLYICFAEMPEAWSIEEEINGEWQTSIEGTTDLSCLGSAEWKKPFPSCWHFGKEKLLEIERSLRFLRRRTAGLGAAMGTYAKEGGFASACCASG